jgi:hypothetical protein
MKSTRRSLGIYASDVKTEFKSVFQRKNAYGRGADRQQNRLMDEPRGSISVSEMLHETWQDSEIQKELTEQYNEHLIKIFRMRLKKLGAKI